MKGISVDSKTGQVQHIDDGLPMPLTQPYEEPAGLNLEWALAKISKIDKLVADIASLQSSRPPK